MKIIPLLFSIFRRSETNEWADGERTKALDILDQHGLRANYYMPAVGMEDQELANACRRLASAGYIITTADGTISGKVAIARPTKNEQLEYRRASFKLVVNK
jgi:hypothetical protein